MNTKTRWYKIVNQDTLENELIDGPPANIDEYEEWLFASDFDFETTCFSDKESGDLVYVRMITADEHDGKRKEI